MGKCCLVVTGLVLFVLGSLCGCGGSPTPDYGKQALDLMGEAIYLPSNIGFVLDAFPSAAEADVMDEFTSYPATISTALDSLAKLTPPAEAEQTHTDLRDWLSNMKSISEDANTALKSGDKAGLEDAYETAINLSAEAQRIIDKLGEVVRASK